MLWGSCDYASDIRRSLEKDIFPAIGDISITDIKARTLVQAINDYPPCRSLKYLLDRTRFIREGMAYTGGTHENEPGA
ncbi:phage integrase central domain-containing protein [Sodalis ligni]|uniref:phage integrase central domain-containing protein n=1 Tax=Sodalis ligni TaxID=2697027 RepID=UPI003C7A5672